MRKVEDGSAPSQASGDEPSDVLKVQGAGRVLIAGEFANDWGHLGGMLAMARAYRAAGHEVLLAVSDLSVAQFFFSADDFPLLQAPVLRVDQHDAPRQGAPVNFADLLWGLGYADAAALAAATDAWIALLTPIDPKLLVYVNAPTAALAARVLGTATLFVGGAFDIPPAFAPLPAFQAGDLSAPDVAAMREAEVLDNINGTLRRFQRPELEFLAELFPAKEVKLTTLTELDPFGPRPAEQYVGPIFSLPPVHRIGWKDAREGIRIFAYLHPQAPGCERVLQALNSVAAEVICVTPGCPASWPAQFDRIVFYAQPLELAFLLPKAHLVVSSGVGTMTTALLTGLPILSVPRTLEQHMVARALERTGASKTLESGASVEGIVQDMSELSADPGYRHAATQVALKYMKVRFEDNARLITVGERP